MKRLNKGAAHIASTCKANAATDITGFSLMGHGWEMANASKVGMEIRFADVPLYNGTQRLAKEWCFAGGAFDNKEFYGGHVHFSDTISEEEQMILFDPQTSGGLLLSIPAEQADDCLQTAKQSGIPIWQIGKVTDSRKIEIN